MANDSRNGEEDEEEEEDDEVDKDALEMLPEHVVSSLKAKYETTSVIEGLDRALKEEEDLIWEEEPRMLPLPSWRIR